jgi:hypothetical protein
VAVVVAGVVLLMMPGGGVATVRGVVAVILPVDPTDFLVRVRVRGGLPLLMLLLRVVVVIRMGFIELIVTVLLLVPLLLLLVLAHLRPHTTIILRQVHAVVEALIVLVITAIIITIGVVARSTLLPIHAIHLHQALDHGAQSPLDVAPAVQQSGEASHLR